MKINEIQRYQLIRTERVYLEVSDDDGSDKQIRGFKIELIQTTDHERIGAIVYDLSDTHDRRHLSTEVKFDTVEEAKDEAVTRIVKELKSSQ